MKTIKGENVYLRPMTIDDSEKLVEWRNSSEILKWMLKKEKITLNNHKRWFISRKNRIDYMIIHINSDLPIGTLNFSISNNIAEAGKILGDKSFRGKGYAQEAFKLWTGFGLNDLNFEKIFVKTKSTNLSNIHINKKIGFLEVDRFDVDDVLIIKMEITKNRWIELS